MNSPEVLFLNEVRAGDTAVAGGKGCNLAELTQAGFPVPAAFVVAASAFRRTFERLGLEGELTVLDKTGEASAACARIRAAILDAGMDDDLCKAILEAHARITHGDPAVHCAVRSSATAEDSSAASFAGQHGTYYYVERARLLEMVRHCWASLWTPEAASYRTTHGIPHETVSMAVVVQRMVRSEVAGVAFTASPISGDRSEIAIESSWGMGAAIVDGRVTPDRYLVARNGLVLRERRIADKRYMVPAERGDDASHRLIEVPHDLRRLETLRADQAQAVAALAVRCEDHFGAPQDVEFALAGGDVYLLQSRPITTLGRQVVIAEPPGKWVLFKAIAENFTEPLTPLTVDFMSAFPQRLIRAIGGRIYMSLDLFRVLLPLDVSDEAMASLVYLSGEGMPQRVRVAWRRVPVTVAVGTMSGLVMAVLNARCRDMPDDFMNQYREACRRVEHDPGVGPADAMRRLVILPSLLAPVGIHVIPVNGVAAMRGPLWTGVVRWLLRRWAPDVRPDAVALLCSGSDGVLSADMGRAVAALADAARESPAVAELLVRSSPDKALGRLRDEPAAGGFVAQFEAFLATHGHRAAKEFELQTPRWDENPAPVLAMIRNHLIESTVDPRPAPSVRSSPREALERELRDRLRWRWRVLSYAAERARYFLKLRENSRFFHIMGFGTVRKKILAVEAELLRDGKLRCRDDIFFLRLEEVAALQAGTLGWTDVEERIRERRIQHVRLAKITPPRTIGIARTEPPPEPAGPVLRGQCASPGRHTGIARVILDPSLDATIAPGEILVAPYTDPAWTPLFLTAGAAVVEVGSYLSHAGTVAREFGMPCVVDVAGCTRRIHSGMRIEVNADTGTVHLLQDVAA